MNILLLVEAKAVKNASSLLHFSGHSELETGLFILINTRQSQVDNLFVKSVHTTQYGIRSLSHTGPKLWNSLSINVKKLSHFPVFVVISRILCVIDSYNSIIDS